MGAGRVYELFMEFMTWDWKEKKKMSFITLFKKYRMNNKLGWGSVKVNKYFANIKPGRHLAIILRVMLKLTL